MATFSKIGEFNAGSEEWSQYVERIGHFFEANGITEERKKRAVLLSVVGYMYVCKQCRAASYMYIIMYVSNAELYVYMYVCKQCRAASYMYIIMYVSCTYNMYVCKQCGAVSYMYSMYVQRQL